MRERGGKSFAQPLDNTKAESIKPAIEERVAPGATVYSDQHQTYKSLYERGTVNHSKKEYVGPGDIHINSTESMWALLKRSIHGTWHHVRQALRRYVDEATFD